jgi:fructose-1,6-bisphosphatase II
MVEGPSRNLGLDLVRITEAGALAAARWMGLGSPDRADQAATAAVVETLESVGILGCTVVGGEGKGRHVLMLGPGAPTDDEEMLDVMGDPVDGVSLLAYGYPGAISVITAAPAGHFRSLADAAYMEKIVVNARVAPSLVPECLDAPAAWTLALVARTLNKPVGALTIFMLDRPRNADLVREIRATGAHVVLRAEGDVTGALLAASREGAIDMLMGIGGVKEGLISACAVKALGGAILGRLAPQSERELEAIQAAGLDRAEVMETGDLVQGEGVFFAATGITDGPLLRGLRFRGNRATTHSMILRGETRTRRLIEAEHLLRS